MQITDPQNKGIGTEARKIIRRIEKLLDNGKKITPLRPKTDNVSGHNDLAERMEEQIKKMIAKKSVEEDQEDEIKKDIDNAVNKWNSNIQNLLQKSKNEINQEAKGELSRAITEYNKLGNQARTVLGDDKFKFELFSSQTQDVGKIGYAFKHAFDNIGMYPIMVSAGCILLDFGILLLIIVSPATQNQMLNNNTSVLNNKNKGKTII